MRAGILRGEHPIKNLLEAGPTHPHTVGIDDTNESGGLQLLLEKQPGEPATMTLRSSAATRVADFGPCVRFRQVEGLSQMPFTKGYA